MTDLGRLMALLGDFNVSCSVEEIKNEKQEVVGITLTVNDSERTYSGSSDGYCISFSFAPDGSYSFCYAGEENPL